MEKKLPGAGFETIRYSYNERGWLTSGQSAHFKFQLRYNNPLRGGQAHYNGNISEQEYSSEKLPERWFTYRYDDLNRLVSSAYSAGSELSEDISYDVMGNIVQLNRNNQSTVYSYHGHRLMSISGALSGSYQYEENGNQTYDGLRGLSIGYNTNNLPSQVSGGPSKAHYRYSALGVKEGVEEGGFVKEYFGDVEYGNGLLSIVHTGEGRAVAGQGGVYVYEYSLRDHLGNTRVMLDQWQGSGRVIQEEEYSGFGLSYSRYVSGDRNMYLYNGKEEQQVLSKQYDYGARFYDPIIGRWMVVDPLAEKYFAISPYTYVANNPIRLIDSDGREIVDPKGNRITYEVGKDGSLTWSKNATADVIRIGNAMAKTEIGLQALSKLDQASFDVTMSINTTDLRKTASGEVMAGYSEPTVNSKGEIVKYDMTVYEKGIDELSTSKPGTRPVVMKEGEKIYMDSYSKDEHIGATGVHETRHITDKNSRRSGSPNKPASEVEKGPRTDEAKYYRELDEQKKQQKP